jgi:hypothetical protein
LHKDFTVAVKFWNILRLLKAVNVKLKGHLRNGHEGSDGGVDV